MNRGWAAAVAFALCWSAVLLCQGCGRAVRQEGVTEFGMGVAQVREQARLAFERANALARERSVEMVLRSNRPGLSEESFAVAVSREDVRAWDNAFATMQAYVSALQQLLSPAASGRLEDATVELGEQLATGRTNVALPPGVAAGFTQLGKALLESRAQRDALRIMQLADPAIREVLTGMADAISAPGEAGLRGTVWSNWETALRGPREAYLAASEVQDEQRRREARLAALQGFLEVLELRDGHLATLDGLRESLLLLADAHTEAARGSPQSASALIALVERHLEQGRALYGRFDEMRAKRAAKPE